MTISLLDQNTIILLFVAFAGMIIWRYLGVLYSKNIDNESIIAKTINSIAYGMTTAIVFKIVFFPDNALNLIPDTDRIIPFFIGIIVFLVFSKNTSFGLIIGISSFSFLILYRNYIVWFIQLTALL